MPRSPITSKNAKANEAFDLLKQGKHKEARDILEKIVHEDTADAAVLETLGDVREKLGDKAGAMDAYGGAVTHLRARGEGKRALAIIELMLIVDESTVTARREAADIRRELGDVAACWRDVITTVEAALHKDDLAAALEVVEAHADVVPDQQPAVAVCRRLETASKREASRMARALAESLRVRGRVDDARVLSALATDIEPALKDVIHSRNVPPEERTDEPWAEKTPEVPASLSDVEDIDDDPTDMDR